MLTEQISKQKMGPCPYLIAENIGFSLKYTQYKCKVVANREILSSEVEKCQLVWTKCPDYGYGVRIGILSVKNEKV